jgi:hypothetical protein
VFVIGTRIVRKIQLDVDVSFVVCAVPAWMALLEKHIVGYVFVYRLSQPFRCAYLRLREDRVDRKVLEYESIARERMPLDLAV